MGIPIPNYRQAGEMLSAYGRRLGQEGDDAGAQHALASAMAIAKHERDLTLEMVTLLNAAWVDTQYFRLQQSGEKSLQAIELMKRLDDPMHGWEALLNVSRVHYNAGDLVEARRHATAYLTMMESIGDPQLLAICLYLNAKIAALGGDWASARQFCDRGLIVAPQQEFLLQVRALLDYAVGEFNQGEVFLERLIEVYRATGPEPDWVHVALLQTISAFAQMTGTTKHFVVARSAAKTVLSSQRVSQVWIWFARTGLALIAAQEGDITTVQEHYRAVRGQRGALMTMDVDRLLGILAAASGEWDEATAYFDAAMATWGKGRHPQFAWTAYEYADMLLQQGNSRDLDKANQLLDKALPIARELGMAPLTERVLLRKEAVNTP